MTTPKAERQALYDRLGLVGQNRTVPQVVLRDGGFDYRTGSARELRGSGVESLFRKGPALPHSPAPSAPSMAIAGPVEVCPERDCYT